MSRDIQQFREILFWPFRFEGNGGGDLQKFLECSSLWHRDEDWLKRDYRCDQARPDETAYAEFVYFHPFVQRFLYSEDSSVSPMKVWRRDDIVGAEVQLADRECPIVRLSVEQVRLFWFDLRDDHGVGILTLEVAATTPLPLSTVQNLLDQFRRVYPPYWEKGVAGRFPQWVTWETTDGSKLNCTQETFSQFWNWADKKRTYPVGKHWRSLLYGKVDPVPSWFDKLRQIEDERMPTMTWLAMDDPRQLTCGDFVRLCFADESGSSDNLPYAPTFLKNFERDYCYDRYWAHGSLDDEKSGAQSWMTTRYMNCGYAFTMVGQAGGFYTDAVSGALSHFRNHYFTMGLIAHFQKAALLSFSDCLSTDVSKPEDKGLHKNARKTLRRLIDFTDRYWFIDLSNQLQARELYSGWRQHLGLDTLYAQVMDEADKLSSYLEGENEVRLQWIVGAASVVVGLLPIWGKFIEVHFGSPLCFAIINSVLFAAIVGFTYFLWRRRR